ncbi:ZIP family metal transporter [Hydrogenophaga sp. 5NK40-0174]
MLSLAAGALMATAFLHLLPEAMEGGADAHDLFAVLLVGLLFFFLLDKAELWHHGHEHCHHHDHDEHEHADEHSEKARQHAHAHAHGGGGWAILAGDSVHAFGDGVLIASAFMADMHLGVMAALAVLAHEVPHHIGDLVVVQHASGNRRNALIKVTLAGTVTGIGGLVGYGMVSRFDEVLPYLLVLASSSFIYVALADLIPQLQKRLNLKATVVQVLWLLAGIAMVMLVRGAWHAH